MDWEKCNHPQHMARVLAHTDLVKSAVVISLKTLDPDGTTQLSYPCIEITLHNNERVAIQIHDMDPWMACEAIRRLIPTVRWSNLRP